MKNKLKLLTLIALFSPVIGVIKYGDTVDNCSTVLQTMDLNSANALVVGGTTKSKRLIYGKTAPTPCTTNNSGFLTRFTPQGVIIWERFYPDNSFIQIMFAKE